MIYEFLYETKPVSLHLIAIAIFWVLVFFSYSVYYYHLSRPTKEKYLTSTTYRYDVDLQKLSYRKPFQKTPSILTTKHFI